MATSVIYELPYTYTMSRIHSLIFQNPPSAQRIVRLEPAGRVPSCFADSPDLVVLGDQRSLCEGYKERQPSDQNPPSAQRIVRLEPAGRVPSCFADSPDSVVLEEDYKEKELSRATFTIPESILRIIQILDDSIVVPIESTTETTTDTKVDYTRIKPSMSGNRRNPPNPRRAPPHTKRDGGADHGSRHSQHRSDKRGSNMGSRDLESDSSNWNALKPVFKATKMETKEGIDKDINDIRILLNKLSNKKYDDQKTEILTLIQTIFEKLEEGAGAGAGASEGAGEAVQKIGQFIFDIASTNQFFSELYAGLYEDLVAQHAVFTEILEVFVAKFQSTLDAVPYCDPNTDYDGFCQYTKHNERRRATASFFVMLVVRKVLSGERLATLVMHIQRIMETAITEENRTNEVEELTEVLFLLITLGATLLRADDSHCWESSIFPALQTMSQRKAKEFTSLSSRAVFKHRDILDKLTKFT